jgi:hypothetical protein
MAADWSSMNPEMLKRTREAFQPNLEPVADWPIMDPEMLKRARDAFRPNLDPPPRHGPFVSEREREVPLEIIVALARMLGGGVIRIDPIDLMLAQKAISENRLDIVIHQDPPSIEVYVKGE